MTRQKTCLIAEGSDLPGFSDSAAARPTSSVPEKEKAAVTNTPQKPTKVVNAPGSCHLLPPWYSEKLLLFVSKRSIGSNLGDVCLLSVGGTATAHENDTHEQEDNDCGELQQ